MEKLTQCPVCSGTENTELITSKDYVSTDETFKITICNNCSLQYTNPRPTEENIGKYYQSDKYISHSGSEKKNLGIIYSIYDIIRNISIYRKINTIKKYNKNGKLLDLGCGMGYFINEIKKDKTYEYEAADVSDEAIKYVADTFGITVLRESNLDAVSNKEYDIITQWHVLEHVHRLDERLQFLKRVLKQNGTMYFAVPINNSFDSKHYKNFWDAYDVPRHLLHFNRKSFNHLMSKHGFTVVAEKPLLFDAPYISMRSEIHKGNKLPMLKGVIIGAISNLSALLTKNYSSIMFIVKHDEK